MSIEKDRDDRRRRLILRLKCLYTTAACSFVSLLSIMLILQIGDRSLREVSNSLSNEIKILVDLLIEQSGIDSVKKNVRFEL